MANNNNGGWTLQDELDGTIVPGMTRWEWLNRQPKPAKDWSNEKIMKRSEFNELTNNGGSGIISKFFQSGGKLID